MSTSRNDALLDASTISARLAAELPDWRVEAGHLIRVFRSHGWKGTLLMTGAVAHLAELAWHHPELALSWDRLEVRLTTHDAGGITAKDFALAAKIDEMLLWSPEEEDGPLSGTPNGDPRFAYVKRER